MAAPAPRGSAGRELGLVLLACALGAGAVLLAGGRDWVTAVAVQGDLRAPVRVRGSSMAPVATALGLAGLAGAAAVVATRGAARRIAGLVLLLCGLGAGYAAAAAASSPDDDVQELAGDVLGAGSAKPEDRAVTAWPWVATAGGALVAVAGAATLARGPAWPGMGARYDAPARPAPARREDTPIDQWRALDRGEDPTAD